MIDERPAAPTARDIAAGWLLCTVIAVLALGIVSAVHGGIPPGTAAVAAIRSPASAGARVCTGSAQACRVRVLARSYHAFPPMSHPDNRPHA